MNQYEATIRHRQDDLALKYLPAVKAMAYKLKERLPSSVYTEDLIAIATEELIKLARRYDPKKNDNFWGYAKQRVYGSMLDFLRSIDVVSRGDRKIIKEVEREIERYYNENQHEPDDDYLAQTLGYPVAKIKKARVAGEIYNTMPIDDQLNFFQDISKEVEAEELIEIIQTILSTLGEREQTVIQLYYFEELSLKEISDILHITESRISQIHKAVIRKIREAING